VGSAKAGAPVKIRSVGGTSAPKRRRRRPTRRRASSSMPTARSWNSGRAADSRTRRRACGSATCSNGSRGGSGSRKRRSGSPTSGPRTRGARRRYIRPDAEPTGLTTTEYPHYQNFNRRGSAPGDPKVLTCDVLEGHLSSTLAAPRHISYLVGRALVFDGKKETFVDDRRPIDC